MAKAQRALEESVFYQEVLTDLQARYEKEHYGAEGQSWDSYMQEMLELVSPDYSTNTREEGMREFCQAAGISEELTDLEELAGDLSRVYRVSELEELIIEYKVSGAAYQNTGYKRSCRNIGMPTMIRRQSGWQPSEALDSTRSLPISRCRTWSIWRRMI